MKGAQCAYSPFFCYDNFSQGVLIFLPEVRRETLERVKLTGKWGECYTTYRLVGISNEEAGLLF